MTTTHALPATPQHQLSIWRLLSPASLAMTVAASVLGMASAASCGCGFDGQLALVTLVLALGAHVAVNLLGGHAEMGAGQPLRAGLDAAAAQARPWAHMLLVLLPLAGLWLAARSGGSLLWLGAGGLLLVAAYLAPPLRLVERGGGELLALAVWWLVVIGADYAQRRQLFLIPASMGLSVGLLAAAIPLASGMAADPSDPRRSLARRLGRQAAALLYSWLVVLAHGWLAVSVWLLIPPLTALWGLVSLPVSLLAAVWLWQGRARARPAVWLSLTAAVLHPLAVAAALSMAALQR